ncbi:MAG: hypothetical protein MR297_00285, partial [Tenericutes bacterium]|nr:hypothetical protein [Mycoplasmatota bacterium]
TILSKFINFNSLIPASINFLPKPYPLYLLIIYKAYISPQLSYSVTLAFPTFINPTTSLLISKTH